MSPLEKLEFYNEKLNRYKNMEKWIEGASYKEQIKQEKHIYEVINDCAAAYNELGGNAYEDKM